MIGKSKAESLLTIIIFLALSPGSHPEVELANTDWCPIQNSWRYTLCAPAMFIRCRLPERPDSHPVA